SLFISSRFYIPSTMLLLLLDTISASATVNALLNGRFHGSVLVNTSIAILDVKMSEPIHCVVAPNPSPSIIDLDL
ncbi:MAG: hypothetical protein AABO57_09190, partial [Acidobacteriota bacterium]